MPWKVKRFLHIEKEDLIYDDWQEAEDEADQIMLMQPGQVMAIVVECDEDGDEV